MPIFREVKSTLEKALKSGVSAKETRDLVQCCAFLALPLVRKKIGQGRLNLDLLAMTEEDIVFDSLAELFQRDGQGRFPQLDSYFTSFHLGELSEAEIIIHLRKIVFINVHKTIIRLYSETDPTMGKILRNIKLGISKTDFFEEAVRFGETMLVVKNMNPLFNKPLIGSSEVQRALHGVVNVRDTIPAILAKLFTVFAEQEQFQRALPLFQLATTVKEVYVVGWETESVVIPTVEEEIDTKRIRDIIGETCRKQLREMRHSYIETEKVSEEMFYRYFQTVESILKEEYLDGSTVKRSYFDHFAEHCPNISLVEYRDQHRTTIEYLTKKTRTRLQLSLKAM